LKVLELFGLRISAHLRAIDAASTASQAIHFAPNHKADKDKIYQSAPTAATSSTANKPIGAYAFVQGTPIYTMTPRLFPASSPASGVSLNQKRVAILTDQKDWWRSVEESGALIGFAWQVICPAGAGVQGAMQVDIGSEKSAETSLRPFDAGSIDAILVLKDLIGRSTKGWLENDLGQEIALAELLFAVTKHCYQRIAEGSISVSSVCLNAFNGKQLDPYTGLIAGFMKSLARELPQARCSVVNLDDKNLLRALRCTEVELGQEAFAGEVSFRNGDRYIFRLQSVDALAADERGFLTQDSVVIATGGGRGVTAALCEALLERYGCTIVALGRTTVSGVPEQILGMTAEEYLALEGEFYRAELLRNPRQQITELRKLYWSYQAANELQQVIKRLGSLGGAFEYNAVDITDAVAVDELVRGVYDRYGRVDLVLHGAGIQVSKIIPKKTIEVFHKVVTTKLASLRFLYRACRQRCKGSRVHFHLLTSAFSYLGNDGQPDYGAANEAMNRIADAMSVAEPDASWSSMAWLGWAGIGMTRGTEFAALAANRRLRGVTKEEGKKIFRTLLAGNQLRRSLGPLSRKWNSRLRTRPICSITWSTGCLRSPAHL
jgi:NAD(P)-dependent dehydrogenase (short-subunit alcohol dehydrogenase family)